LAADCEDVDEDEEEPPHPAIAIADEPSRATARPRAFNLIMLLVMSDLGSRSCVPTIRRRQPFVANPARISAFCV
jgi:hypothetical protein